MIRRDISISILNGWVKSTMRSNASLFQCEISVLRVWILQVELFNFREKWKRLFLFWNATCCLAIGDEYDINISVLFTCEILAHSAPQAVAWRQQLALPSSLRLIPSAGRRFRGPFQDMKHLLLYSSHESLRMIGLCEGITKPKQQHLQVLW